jgi:hypothetical protein
MIRTFIAEVAKRIAAACSRLLAAQDRQVGQGSVRFGNHNIVFREKLGSGKSDVELLVLLLLDRDRLFNTVVMQTHTLDRNKVLTGRDRRDVDAILVVSRKHLEDNPGTGVVEPVENNQYGILMVLGVDVVELKTKGAGIHNLGRSGGRRGRLGRDFTIICKRSDGDEGGSNERY